MHTSTIRFLRLICLSQVFILSATLASAQPANDDTKLQALKTKISMAESKVDAAEAKLAIADSLITYGEERINQAEERFAHIGEEQKQLEKDYKADLKSLKKLSKSKDEEIAKQAAADLKAREKQFTADLKSQSAEIKLLTKQAAKGESDMAKGLKMHRDTSVKLKEANEALELARSNYDDYVNRGSGN